MPQLIQRPPRLLKTTTQIAEKILPAWRNFLVSAAGGLTIFEQSKPVGLGVQHGGACSRGGGGEIKGRTETIISAVIEPAADWWLLASLLQKAIRYGDVDVVATVEDDTLACIARSTPTPSPTASMLPSRIPSLLSDIA